jgi:hypothetical protein
MVVAKLDGRPAAEASSIALERKAVRRALFVGASTVLKMPFPPRAFAEQRIGCREVL